jgi:hypothetical protein
MEVINIDSGKKLNARERQNARDEARVARDLRGTLLLHFCYLFFIVLLHCCYTVVTMLSHCCYAVVTLLLHFCYLVGDARRYEYRSRRVPIVKRSDELSSGPLGNSAEPMSTEYLPGMMVTASGYTGFQNQVTPSPLLSDTINVTL